MKILHLFDTAGIGALLSDELNRHGHQSSVLQLEALDPQKVGIYYNSKAGIPSTTYFKDADRLISTGREMAKFYDWIIIHDMPEALESFRGLDKVCMFYHGSKLRHTIFNDDLAVKLFVATPDLLDLRPTAFWIPTPIDTELFKLRIMEYNANSLTINQERNKKLIYEYLTNDERFSRIHLEYFYRPPWRDYKDMPELLYNYGKYFDIKFDYSHPAKLIKAMSATGLQALSCGLTVYDYKLEPQNYLPFQHIAVNSMRTLLSCLDDYGVNEPKTLV